MLANKLRHDTPGPRRLWLPATDMGYAGAWSLPPGPFGHRTPLGEETSQFVPDRHWSDWLCWSRLSPMESPGLLCHRGPCSAGFPSPTAHAPLCPARGTCSRYEYQNISGQTFALFVSGSRLPQSAAELGAVPQAWSSGWSGCAGGAGAARWGQHGGAGCGARPDRCLAMLMVGAPETPLRAGLAAGWG